VTLEEFSDIYPRATCAVESVRELNGKLFIKPFEDITAFKDGPVVRFYKEGCYFELILDCKVWVKKGFVILKV
jgi:hypothetical protein